MAVTSGHRDNEHVPSVINPPMATHGLQDKAQLRLLCLPHIVTLLPPGFLSNHVLCPECFHTQAGSRVFAGVLRAEVRAEPSPGDPGVTAPAPHSRRPRLRIGPHRAPCAPGSRSPAGRWASAGGRAPLRDRSRSAEPSAPPWLLLLQIPAAVGVTSFHSEALPLRQPQLPGCSVCGRDHRDE